MKHSPIKSSTIKSHAYDPQSQVMELMFHDGGHYSYKGVPQHVYDDLVGHESPGSFLHTRIKGFYKHEKVGA